MATAIGQRYLERYAAGTATLEQLQLAVARGWVTPAEYDTATRVGEEIS